MTDSERQRRCIEVSEIKRGRAELAHREWVEFEIALGSDGKIQDIQWRAWGCHNLIETSRKASLSFSGKDFVGLDWPGAEHWDLLINEAFSRAKGTFQIPVDDPETCHCRKIPTSRVDEAIVLGAHTP